MGCDIFTYAERKTPNGYELVQEFYPFNWRDYGLFGFLANVRNYSGVPPISLPRGAPDGVCEIVSNKLTSLYPVSWLSVTELASFDYDQQVEDRRTTEALPFGGFDDGATCEAGGGKMTTYREILDEFFFQDLERLVAIGADRVIFGFDG